MIADLAPNTRRNYRERYIHNIQPVIGGMLLSNVKPMHCKVVLNRMEADYAGSTIRQAYITVGTMFKSALMNDLIIKHPMNGVRYSKPVRAVDDIKYLTVEEQGKFLETAQRSHNYAQYALILETGLRTGEVIGLTWDAIDWEKRTLTVNKTLEYRHKQAFWRAGPPKTQQSYRTIPLTNRAYEILQKVELSRAYRKESPMLSQTLEYIDRRTGVKSQLVMRWSSSISEPGCRTRIAPCISFVMKRESSDFVCTRFAIPTQLGQLRAVCSRRFCRNCSVMPALKRQWIAMFM